MAIFIGTKHARSTTSTRPTVTFSLADVPEGVEEGDTLLLALDGSVKTSSLGTEPVSVVFPSAGLASFEERGRIYDAPYAFGVAVKGIHSLQWHTATYDPDMFPLVFSVDGSGTVTERQITASLIALNDGIFKRVWLHLPQITPTGASQSQFFTLTSFGHSTEVSKPPAQLPGTVNLHGFTVLSEYGDSTSEVIGNLSWIGERTTATTLPVFNVYPATGYDHADRRYETYTNLTIEFTHVTETLTAIANAAPTSGVAPLEVVFDSSDSTGDIVAYHWDFDDGNTSSDANPTHEFTEEGIYNVVLTITDAEDNTSQDSVEIIVNYPPPTPVITGPSYTDTEANTLWSGTDSEDDYGGEFVKYSWLVLEDHPSYPTYHPSTHGWDIGQEIIGSTINVSDLGAGTWTVFLRVEVDTPGGLPNRSDFTSREIIVTEPDENIPPTAVIDVNATTGDPLFKFSFSSSNSFDLDGTIVSRLWDFDGLGTSTAENVNWYFEPGVWTVTLLVTDDDGDSDSAEIEITVEEAAENQPPVSYFVPSVEGGDAPLIVVFTSDLAFDPDGEIVTYFWNFGDGQISTTQNATHEYKYPGVYSASLTVVDDRGAYDTYSVDITVTGEPPGEPEDPPGTPPTAVIKAVIPPETTTHRPTIGYAPLTVNFDASDSTDPEDDIATYYWDFGVEEFNFGLPTWSTSINPSRTFGPGQYTVTLTVTDEKGNAGYDWIVIIVLPPPGPEIPGGGGWTPPPLGEPIIIPPPGPGIPLPGACPIASIYTDITSLLPNSPNYTASWTAQTKSDTITFRVRVRATEDIEAYYLIFGAITTSFDGYLPGPNPTLSSADEYLYGDVEILSETGVDIVHNVEEGIFAGVIQGGVMPAGSAVTLRVTAAAVYPMGYAALVFANSGRFNVGVMAAAYINLTCETGGWSVGMIG